MTKQEAIRVLKDDAEFLYKDDHPINRKAYDMAIEALNRQDDDLISRQDAIDAVENNSYGMGSRASVKAIKTLPSASADVGDYTEVLEKIIVDAEPVWICEDTPCPEWCNENCNYPSIQVDCLRHLYLVKRCNYGNDQEG